MTVRERWAEVVVDLDAIAHNTATLANRVAPASLWAVVKADGYGHGAYPVARTAIAAGAHGACVALVDEGVALRDQGVSAPILVLSPQPPEQLRRAVDHDLILTVHDADQIAALEAGAIEWGRQEVAVHLKVDTGMRRVGTRPEQAVDMARRIVDASRLTFDGVFSHLACADDPRHPATPHQLDIFDGVLTDLAGADLSPRRVHLANSAGALAWPESRHDLVRCGIALYGLAPGPGVAEWCDDLRPALSVRSRVSMVKRIHAGDGVSYGWRTTVERDLTAATIPLGYADGVPRALGTTGGEVLIGGRRRRILGVVTMDQFVVDCGDDDVAVGDEVVLIGDQQGTTLGVEDWAERLGTITYEIVCGLSARMPRRWVGGPR